MRIPRQVFDDHWNAILSGNMGRILSDYALDAVFVTPGNLARGHGEIEEVFTRIDSDLGTMAIEQESVTVGDSIILFEWSGKTAVGRIAQGTDTFYIEHGLIQFQTLAYSVGKE